SVGVPAPRIGSVGKELLHYLIHVSSRGAEERGVATRGPFEGHVGFVARLKLGATFPQLQGLLFVAVHYEAVETTLHASHLCFCCAPGPPKKTTVSMVEGGVSRSNHAHNLLTLQYSSTGVRLSLLSLPGSSRVRVWSPAGYTTSSAQCVPAWNPRRAPPFVG
ncbi:hypothetical protein GBAR_LOCUS22719, partial [Geodia barretti]